MTSKSDMRPNEAAISTASALEGREDFSASRDHAHAGGVALEDARRDLTDLRQYWDAFTDADPTPDDFIERMEAAGYAELRDVNHYDLDDSFAAERGIEAGGMVWSLTAAGRSAFSSQTPAERDKSREAK